jgi:hypothetical protein
MQPLHDENMTTINDKLASVKLNELLAQNSILQKLLVTKLARIWQTLVCFRTTQEPQVTWMHDRTGRSYFKIYDPITEQYHCADSEQEVRVWLERSRHQQPEKKYRQLDDKTSGRFDYFQRH